MSADQLSLFGFDPTPQKPAAKRSRAKSKPDFNLFLACMPDESDAQRIYAAGADLRTECGLSGRVIDAKRLHVSLLGLQHFMKPLLNEQIASWVARIDQLLSKLDEPAIQVVSSRVSSFGGKDKRPLVLLCDALAEAKLTTLQIRVCERLFGSDLPAQRFKPHMSLLYDSAIVAEREIHPIEWTARKLVLILSHVGQGKYDRLKEWPLA